MEHKSRSPSPPPPKVAPPTLLSQQQQQQQGQDSWAKGIFSTPPPEPPKKPTASATPPPPPSSPTSQQPPSPLPPATPPSAVDSPTTTTTKSASPSPSAAAHVCGYCGKPATKKCTRCKNTHYCSRECQTKDWQFGHKGVCTQTPPKGLPENALASSNFLPQRFDLSEKPLEGPPALRGAPQDLGPLQKAIKSFISTPPVPYGFTNDTFVSCYVNCVVQCLFSLPLFRTYLLRRVHSSKHKSGVIQSRKDCFLCELENACLRHMELPYSTSLAWISENVSSLTKTLALGMQEDAHEFLIAVLSCMEREATEAGRDPVGSDIAQMFGGWTCRLSECAACKHVETTYERYSVLSADVTNTTGTLTDSLRSLIAPEQIAGVTCASCKKSVKVSVRNMFASYPPVLIFHLKRFMEASRAKAECHVSFPERLDMTPYLLPSYAAPTKPGAESTAAAVGTSHFEYRLTGVVAHYGVTSFGHYVSYAVNSDGEWFMYSDDRVLEVPFSTVAAAQAYILFYQQANTELLGVPCCLKDGPLSESAPCLGGCGMFGTKENSYYCSVCFKKHFPNGKK